MMIKIPSIGLIKGHVLKRKNIAQLQQCNLSNAQHTAATLNFSFAPRPSISKWMVYALGETLSTQFSNMSSFKNRNVVFVDIRKAKIAKRLSSFLEWHVQNGRNHDIDGGWGPTIKNSNELDWYERLDITTWAILSF